LAEFDQRFVISAVPAVDERFTIVVNSIGDGVEIFRDVVNFLILDELKVGYSSAQIGFYLDMVSFVINLPAYLILRAVIVNK